jgi:hypothetical protein
MKPDKTLFFLFLISLFVFALAVKVNFSSGDFKLGGFLTGFATAGNTTSAKLNVTIESGLLINFTIDTIEWGSGRVTGSTNGTLDTSKSGTDKVSGGTWFWQGTSNKTDGFIIENVGNVNATLYLKTAKNATNFIGGTSPVYQFNITNNKTGSCINSSGFALGQFYNVNTTSDGTKVCDTFASGDTKDTIRIDVLLTIPTDSNLGALSDIITATAMQG